LKDRTGRGTFIDLVFRLILFHQSLDGLAFYPPIVALTKEEQFYFCDPYFLKLMHYMQVADSGSYYFVFDKRGVNLNTKEFIQSNKNTIMLWEKRNEKEQIKV